MPQVKLSFLFHILVYFFRRKNISNTHWLNKNGKWNVSWPCARWKISHVYYTFLQVQTFGPLSEIEPLTQSDFWYTDSALASIYIWCCLQWKFLLPICALKMSTSFAGHHRILGMIRTLKRQISFHSNWLLDNSFTILVICKHGVKGVIKQLLLSTQYPDALAKAFKGWHSLCERPAPTFRASTNMKNDQGFSNLAVSET